MSKRIITDRLQLRELKDEDAKALFVLLSDEEVTRFLPMFSLKTMEATKAYMKQLRERILETKGYYYVITLKEDDQMIGYINVGGADSYDFGYGLRKEYWYQGIVSEASLAVLERLKADGIPYVTATHDVNNPRSGLVMQRLGMKYCYSYQERWLPKNIDVTFRMYQLNFDGSDAVYQKYCKQYPHFIETIE